MPLVLSRCICHAPRQDELYSFVTVSEDQSGKLTTVVEEN